MQISTHTPHARRDARVLFALAKTLKFLLTRLMRGVTASALCHVLQLVISTHTPHARRDTNQSGEIHTLVISTHTPHARRDTPMSAVCRIIKDFYSHASCEA